jgi:aromatic ring-opening dioxygenase catalytic subunit (LigB family)
VGVRVGQLVGGAAAASGDPGGIGALGGRAADHGSTSTQTPLTYDFGGFPQRYYDVTYGAPGAPDLATRVEALMPDGETVAHDPNRRLDHGAYVPLTVMYPDASIPVLQMSMPTPYAHPTIEHFAPLFVALGASQDAEQVPRQVIDGFWMGLAKRSLELV